MRKILLFIAGLGLVVLAVATASTVMADNGVHGGYSMVTDSCAGCHRAHTAKGEYLLKESTTLGLCLACHGTSGVGANTNVEDGLWMGTPPGTSTALKGGGFSYALMDTNADQTAVSTTVTSKHTYDGSAATVWGSGAITSTAYAGGAIGTGGLSCTNCHDPHGTGTYRILRKQPHGYDVDGSSGAGDYTGGITVTDELTKQYTVNDNPIIWGSKHSYDNGGAYVTYTLSSANYYFKQPYTYTTNISVSGSYTTGMSIPITTTPVNGGVALSFWCSQCHDRYNAPTQSYKTSSGDAVFNYRHRTYSVSVSGGTPTCMTCHVAHGTSATMGTYSGGVKYPDGTVAAANNDRSSLLRLDSRGVCNACHAKQ